MGNRFSGCVTSSIDEFLKGENQDTKNVLYWNTATETNLDVYSIEKSLNGKNFETIGTVTPSTPNSVEPQSYTFTDLKPVSGLNYYRLKIIDLDTKFEYSKIITVFVDEKASAISLYPNPTTSFVEIKGLADNETVNIRLIDALGRTMRFESIPQGERVDVSNFPNGTYFIEIMTENGSTIKRFIKN
ncbi:MAG: T9SS type A sorting domain-containing protein [Saprospiraceae bacterium]|nr:T9SS type A sorting domain-containing protein [Saprospiraceae bacterium]